MERILSCSVGRPKRKPASQRSLPQPPSNNENSLNCSLHCEVALALRYLSKHPDDSPALSCIGVSKPSCFACWSFLKCVRGISINLSTRGTHEKIYFPWRYPGEELGVSNYASHADRIHNDLYSIFAERYTTCVRPRRMEVVSGMDRFEDNEDSDAFSYAWAAVELKRKEHAEFLESLEDAGRPSNA